MIELGAQQAAVVPLFAQWWEAVAAGRPARPFFYVAGFGGTGKTHLALHLAEQTGLAPARIGGGAMQANAALVLARRTGWTCLTLHRWLCDVNSVVGGPTWFTLNPDSPAKALGLFVVDELSLLSEPFWHALLALGVPVLALGDPGQLAAIGGPSVARSLEPDAFLTEIHRQAAGNPIIAWSLAARLGTEVPYGRFADAAGVERVRKVRLADLTAAELCAADVVLVWRNVTRRQYNEWHRQTHGLTGLPQRGERMICLRNQTEFGLVNGFNATVLEAGRARSAWSYGMTVRVHETDVIVPNRMCALGLVAPAPPAPTFMARLLSDFDFGYCKTVNKFIGDQASRVVLIDERPPGGPPSGLPGGEANSWRYVGMSRAVDHLTIATPWRCD